MTLSQEFFARIQEDIKPNPNSPKKILYFVGPPACGKSTKVRRLKQVFGRYFQYIIAEEYEYHSLEETNKFDTYLTYMQGLWDCIIESVKTSAITHQNTIFVSGHPILGLLESEALYHTYEGSIITEKVFNTIKNSYEDSIEYVNRNEIFKDFQQLVYYINIPLATNLELLRKKTICAEITGDLKRHLECIRDNIHSKIFDLASQFTNTEVIEVNTLMGLDIIHMYLLGIGCGC